LSKLLSRLLLRHKNRSRALDGIRSADEFRAILNRERARVDRNGHAFSLVVFDAFDDVKDSSFARHLADVLSRRVRAIDEIGWFDGRIGIVLPYTTPDLAWKLPSDVCRMLGTEALSASYSVYSYPSRTIRGEDSARPDTQLHAADTPKEYDEITTSIAIQDQQDQCLRLGNNQDLSNRFTNINEVP
jgi:hypothetical protein